MRFAFSWSDHSRNGLGRVLGSVAHWKSRFRIKLFSANFCQMFGGHVAWLAQYLVRLEGDDVALRNVNDVSYVMRINHEIHFAWQVQHFGEVHVSFFVAGAPRHLVKFIVSLFVAGAAFGEVHVSLFVAGAAFGEVHVALFVAGAAFGEVHVSLFVAGAACGESWNDRRSRKFCGFSWSDHSRIMLGTVSDRSRHWK